MGRVAIFTRTARPRAGVSGVVSLPVFTLGHPRTGFRRFTQMSPEWRRRVVRMREERKPLTRRRRAVLYGARCSPVTHATRSLAGSVVRPRTARDNHPFGLGTVRRRRLAGDRRGARGPSHTAGRLASLVIAAASPLWLLSGHNRVWVPLLGTEGRSS